jgi:hypothetical protein
MVICNRFLLITSTIDSAMMKFAHGHTHAVQPLQLVELHSIRQLESFDGLRSPHGFEH